ncbi:MAG TPA: exodeoxyribonuclease VII small subunit, partial [Gemmatimonadaceae bacterium]|nr:exodeoxyribonuclease VII small subunit [Gemmatimonadaceae bacterium]
MKVVPFETRLARIESIVTELQREDVPLARALALFEEGVAALRAANEELTRAEATVHRLVEGDEGSFGL